jgi:hypothetical protein
VLRPDRHVDSTLKAPVVEQRLYGGCTVAGADQSGGRRDDVMLARLRRAGELTEVWVPDAAHEAMRDLVRARATAIKVLSKARQQLCGISPAT